MSRLVWGESGSRHFQSGVDRGVLYPQTGPGVPWNGLVSVNDTSVESVEDALYLDGQRVQERKVEGSFTANVKAFTYPPELDDNELGYILGEQRKKSFGFSYRTGVGEAGHGLGVGHLIHLVYNAIFVEASVNRSSINASNETLLMDWSVTTKPIFLSSGKTTAHLYVDTRKAYSWTVEAFENVIYGTEGDDPRIPNPQEVLDLFEDAAILKVIDHRDGTWTAEARPGYEHIIQMLDTDLFEITWPSAVYIDTNTYNISSL